MEPVLFNIARARHRPGTDHVVKWGEGVGREQRSGDLPFKPQLCDQGPVPSPIWALCPLLENGVRVQVQCHKMYWDTMVGGGGPCIHAKAPFTERFTP